ncbi:MAG: M16 family metallopeptidase [Pyrinomonadaceae bacterium]
MKIIRTLQPFVIAALFAASAVGLCAQTPAATPKLNDLDAQAAAVTEFDVNGLKVIVKRRPSAATVAAGLFIRGGARNVTDKTAGIENLMVNAAVEAGKKYPRTAVRQAVARSGGSIGASAGRDFSVFSLASTRQSFDRLWDIFADVALDPAFDPSDVERVREQILTGIRSSEITPDAALEALEQRVIYAGHPYGNDVAGTAATIASFTPQQLRDHHKRVMQTSQLLLVVVGDVDPAVLKGRVATTFGRLPVGDYRETPIRPIDFSKPTLDIMTRSLQTNYVQGLFEAPALGSPDFYAMRVATNILQEMVFNEVRVRRQLSYAPGADLGSDAANTGSIYVTAVDANRAVSVMLDQIKTLKSKTLNQAAIEDLTGQFLTTYYLKQQTNAAQAGDLARYELLGGGWRNSFRFLERIEAVTAEDVRRVANKYMKNIRFVVVGDPKAVDRSVFIPAG